MESNSSVKRRKAKIALCLVSAIFAAYLGGFISLRLLQTRLIFFPPSRVLKAKSKEINPIYKEVWIPVGNQKLKAWWLPSRRLNSRVILYLHGNANDLKDLKDKAQFFHKLEFSVLLIDYRGYGDSKGEFPNEKRVYEDAEAAWEYLTHHRRIPTQNIWVYGHSLGGAIAIELVKRNPRMGGLIIEGSFTSMQDMMDYKIPWQIFPKNLVLTQKFDSINKVKFVRIPILFIHGSDDQIVPPDMSRKLFMASSVPKSLLIIPNAGHSDVEKIGGKRYRLTILNFIKNHQNSLR